MEPLGVCVIGAGDMGRTHARCWRQVEGARLVVVSDSDADRARQAQEEFGFEDWSTDYREALEMPGINVVSVCVPSAYHRECSVAAMERGYHVLCEKPIALTEEDALAMIRTAEMTGAKLALGFCKRFSNLVRKLTEIVGGGRIGRPVMYRFCTAWERRYKLWIMDRRYGGGPVIDFASHFFDQWRVIFGSDPVRVKASGMTFSVGAPELIGVEPELDTATVLVEFDSGDIGMISISWGLPRGVSTPNHEDILGPDGAVLIHGHDKLTVKTRDGEQVIDGLQNDMYLEQVQAFAEAVRKGQPAAATAEDGLIALRVSLGAIESARSGRAVELGGLP
ncbi:MAG: Gfo/Idh/MocA family oxidoreductase [Armatimonadetes bacterium]|nr:Gfo/Idh/MocA family oxidoreductase [Armatimonadota bacterium]